MENIYITTPIYYVNAEPHLGHAYSTIVADVINRFYILSGAETFFLTGTDEHGDKIAAAAQRAGETPREYVDRYSRLFRELWPKLNISNDYFVRTTDPDHQEAVKLILTRVYDKGDIYFSEYEGLYCFDCERFLTERELVEGTCPDHLKEPVPLREANYFFRMSKYQDWLIGHIKENPDFIRPERYKNEVLSFLKEPLDDLCISRPKSRLTWGITLPFDENFVTYVWFDALINYVSALGFPDGANFVKFWPYAQHIIAKDILKPHGIYWPCMLKSAGIQPYRHLNVHGYWNVNEGKMSKSLGNIVSPLGLVDIYGLDAFRYFLLREMVFGLDSEFSEEALIGRINSDLANDLGNLVSRSMTMVSKYFKGRVPRPGSPENADRELKENALALIGDYRALMRELSFHKALIAVWGVIGKVNKYIDTMAPWVLAKTDRDRLSTVIFHIAETLKIISGLLWPVMPSTAEKIQAQLGLEKIGPDLSLDLLREWGATEPVRPLTTAPALFPRIEAEAVQKAEETAGGTFERRSSGTIGPTRKQDKNSLISFAEFQKLDLRVGTIEEAEAVNGSKNLMKLKVNVGDDRTIVAGLLGYYDEKDLPGKQVIVAANLKPAKLMGIESQGMVLAAEDETGPHLLIPDTRLPPGSKVK